jgi:hypothetical protein
MGHDQFTLAGRRRHRQRGLGVLVAAATVLLASTASAQERGPHYRNPTGSIIASGSAGVAVGGPTTIFVVGVGVGYSVIHGVVPGVRGALLAGNDVAGEVAATLLLTPPFEAYVVPFAVAELGGRFQRGAQGLLYGAGGGLYIGEPRSRFGLRAGWMFARIDFGELGAVDASGPLFALSVAF